MITKMILRWILLPCFLMSTICGNYQARIGENDDQCACIIDFIQFDCPSTYTFMKTSKDYFTYDFAFDVGCHIIAAPGIIRSEKIALENKAKVIAFSSDFNKNGFDVVEYTSKNPECTKIINTYAPCIIRFHDYKSKTTSYLYDGYGVLLSHYGIDHESKYPSECYHDIPEKWIPIINILSMARSDAKKKISTMTSQKKNIFGDKFREYYYNKNTSTFEDGAIDSKFLSYVYEDNCIDKIAFKDVAEILKRRKMIIKEVIPLIKEHGCKTTEETLNIVEKEGAQGFRQVEILVGIDSDNK